MSSFLCFVCHSTVNADTNEDTRDKYRDVIGMHLCPDSHLCYICCHFLNKMWLFKAICLKRSLEYPVLFSEKGTINLQRSDTQVAILCPEDICLQHLNSSYHFYNNIENCPSDFQEKYVQLHEEMQFGLLPNNVEVQTDDIFDHFNVNLLKSDTGDDHFNNEEFLVGITKENNQVNTRKDVDEFIFGNDSIESPPENINKIELTNLEEISEVNITLTDLNVRNFVETSKEFRHNDFLAKSQEYYVKNNIFVEKSQEFMKNSCFVEKSQEYVTNNNFVEKPQELRNNDCVDTQEYSVRNNKNNDYVEKTDEYSVRYNNFADKPPKVTVTNNIFVEKSQDAALRNNNTDEKLPELVSNIDFVEKSQELRNNDFVEKMSEVSNKNFTDVPEVINSENQGIEETNIVANYSENQGIPNDEKQFNDTTTDNDNDSFEESSSEETDNDKDPNENDKTETRQNSKKNIYNKITLSVEEQKMDLEANRRDKKYAEAVFKCQSCAMGFLFKDSYQAHMMRHEESNGEYRCSICTLRFANPAILRAHRANHAVRYQCALCEVTLKGRHRQTHACRGETTRRVACQLCASVFPGPSHYQQHIKRAHPMRTNRVYLCNVCGKRCNNQAAVRTHMITHINRKFSCDVCSSAFRSPYTLNQHKRKHNSSETEVHYCLLCNVGFKTRKGLLAHHKNALAHKEKVYKCPLCNRTCPTERALHDHTRALHARTKDLFCAVCPARYSTRKGLVRHMGTHSDGGVSQSHLCHACGNIFKSSSTLKRHLKNVCEKNKQTNKLQEEMTNYYEQ